MWWSQTGIGKWPGHLPVVFLLWASVISLSSGFLLASQNLFTLLWILFFFLILTPSTSVFPGPHPQPFPLFTKWTLDTVSCLWASSIICMLNVSSSSRKLSELQTFIFNCVIGISTYIYPSSRTYPHLLYPQYTIFYQAVIYSVLSVFSPPILLLEAETDVLRYHNSHSLVISLSPLSHTQEVTKL